MKLTRIRVYAAGLVAFLIGIPLTEKAFAQVGDIIYSSLGLAGAITESARNS